MALILKADAEREGLISTLARHFWSGKAGLVDTEVSHDVNVTSFGHLA